MLFPEGGIIFTCECVMEYRISVKESLCGEECLLRIRVSCLLYFELLIVLYQLMESKDGIQKTKNKRDLRNFICVNHL